MASATAAPTRETWAGSLAFPLALALGATRWETVYRVLFPAARNGLLAAVLLGVGRAIGETMAVLMATGHAVNIPTSLLDPVRTLTATIAAELGDAVRGGDCLLYTSDAADE